MSENLKIRGRVGVVRIDHAVSRHVFPQLTAQQEPARNRESGPVHPAAVPRIEENLDAMLLAEYERGRLNGIREAEEASSGEARERVAAECRKVEDLLDSLHGQLNAAVARLEREAFRFALAIAGRVVKREVALDDEAVVRQVQEALRRVAGVESVKVRLNPYDEAMIRQHRDMLTAGSESVRELVIETDEKIDRGGCVLETTSGTVDARLFAQLEQIEAALFGQVVA